MLLREEWNSAWCWACLRLVHWPHVLATAAAQRPPARLLAACLGSCTVRCPLLPTYSTPPQAFSPCELFARIRGRTLFFMGDSQTWHFYYSAECFLRGFAPSLQRK